MGETKTTDVILSEENAKALDASIAEKDKTIADQAKAIAAHEATIADQAKTIEEHEAAITELQNTIDEKTAAIIDQSAALKKLQAGKQEITVKEKKPEAKKKAELPKEPVEFEGKKYRFRFASFYYKAVRYEAQDVAIDPEKIAEILEDKTQTILIEVF